MIQQLVPEQVRMLETHNREWRAVATRSGPADRKLVQNAIGRLYAASGHDWPGFVWYESPRELLTFTKSLGGFRLAPLRDSLLQPLRLEASELETKKCFWPMLWGLGTVRFEEFLDQQPALVMETLPPALRRLMVGCLNEMCIGLEFDWISYHDFCDRHLGVKYESRRLERIRLWSEIGNSCYWWAPYEATCFVSDRPAEIHLDARERLHSLRGPAMAFSDGWSLYAIHGNAVSERLVIRPENATLEDLPLDSDLEVLHATIELLGPERFLAAAKAKLVQQDNFGRLHQIQFFDYEPLMVVEVVNATPDPDGKVRRHLLKVPPETESAHEAVAWSFGRRAKDYAPLVQT
jgi:hypothetical protein